MLDAPARLVGEFDAIIFDHDGTIVDSEEAIVRAYRIWANEYGISGERLSEFRGVPSQSISQELVPDRWAEAADRIETLEVENTHGVVAMPGSADAFATLPAEQVAIGTSCRAPLLKARMAAAGLPLPPVVVTFDDVANGKPAPDCFLVAAKRLGTEPGRTLVVEDAPAGIAAARAGGFPVLGVLSTATADQLGADAHVADLSQVRWEVDGDVIRVLV